MTLHEDATRFTVGQADHNMAILNKLIIALCRASKRSNLAQTRQHFCAKPNQAVKLLLSAH
jgi:hypothetical protein